MDAKYLHSSAHEFVQMFAVEADGWFFETDEDAARHDKALEKLIEQRDLGIVTELINHAHTRGSNAVLVAADKLKELQAERDRLRGELAEARERYRNERLKASHAACEFGETIGRLEAEKAGAIKLYEDSEARHCADLRIGIDAAVESYRRDVEASGVRERDLRGLLSTAATFMGCDPDSIDEALVRDYGMVSQEDTRGLIALIHVHLARLL